MGYFFSPVLLFFRSWAFLFFLFFFVFMGADGLSQLLGWRESNNTIRFVSGLGFGLGLPPVVLNIIVVFFAFLSGQ